MTVDDPVFAGDIVRTQGDSALEIRFLDDTVLAQGENSVLDLDEYVFDPASGDGNLAFKLLEGSFRSVTGAIVDHHPENFSLVSPLATIGIRGTTTAHTIPHSWNPGAQETHLVLVYDGKPVFVIPMGDGETRLIDASGHRVDISAIGTSQVTVMTLAEFRYYEQLSTEQLSQHAPEFESPTDIINAIPGTDQPFTGEPGESGERVNLTGDQDGDGDTDADDLQAALEQLEEEWEKLGGDPDELEDADGDGVPDDMDLALLNDENFLMQHGFLQSSLVLNGVSLLTITGSSQALLLAGTVGQTLTGGTGTDLLNLTTTPAPVSTVFTLAATTLATLDFSNLNGQTSVTLSAPTVAGNVIVTPINGAIAAGQTLVVNASSFTAANPLIFDGSLETAGYFNVTGGAGADTLGGSNHNTSGDVLSGGGGNDII
ncbi:MAG: FecR family protein, partial [Proteobacteria bacterium]|nr:FecR family protein [Pseudomonadota bacterium]